MLKLKVAYIIFMMLGIFASTMNYINDSYPLWFCITTTAFCLLGLILSIAGGKPWKD